MMREKDNSYGRGYYPLPASLAGAGRFMDGLAEDQLEGDYFTDWVRDRALSGQERVNLDVLVWNKSGAKFYGGDDAVEQYNEDPEASVFERFEISANAVGRVS